MPISRLRAVYVGRPQLVKTGPESYTTTAIFKTEVTGRVGVGELNIDRDAQADLRFHGGWSKAVYAYSFEHYAFWANELPDYELKLGNFGENLVTEGLLESETYIGDRLRIGTAEFIVTEPRMPCSKLGVRFGRKDIIRRFLKSRRSGIYMAVTKTGEIGAGDEIEVLSRDEQKVSVEDIVRVFRARERRF